MSSSLSEGADRRPVPQYGEYATPEEVAALRGIPTSPPAVAPEPHPAAPSVPDAARSSAWRRADRPLTIVLIVFGVLNLVQYAGALLDFDYVLEIATKDTFAESIDFADAARIGGVVLFAVCLALVLASGAIGVHRLRRGRVAFWVPLLTGALSVLAGVVVIVAIVLLTPGAPGILGV